MSATARSEASCVAALPRSADHRALPLRIKLAYGAPNLASAAMALLIAIHLTKFYADVVLVPLAYVAAAIALARAFDAITDPLVGWISDRTRSRWGRRRPYMAAGAPLCAACFYALFSPPQGIAPLTAAAWFGAAFLLFFLFDTVCIVPHNALGPELTLDYHERSSLFGWRAGFTVLGTFAGAILPGMLESWLGDPRQAFSFLAAGCAFALMLFYAILVGTVRERSDFATRKSNPLVPGVRRALANRPFRILLSTYAIFAIAGAMPGLLLPFMNAYVIRPPNPSQFLALGLGLYIGMGFLFVPVWVRVSRRIGKRAAWLCAIAIGIVTNGAAWFLGEGDMLPAALLLAAGGTQFGAPFVLAPSIQADAIDYDELLTGRRREAQYGAFWSIVPKLIAIPSAAIPIALLDAIGYVPNAPQSPQVLLTIRALFAVVPAAFATIAFLFAWRFPITETVHRAILNGIEDHRRGIAARDPLTGRMLPPPQQRSVPEEIGWFLDYFSPRELRLVLGSRPTAVLARVWRATLAAAVLFGSLAVLAARELGDFTRPPSVWAAPSVAAAGLALAALCFHAMRIGPARRLARAGISPELVSAHLRARDALSEKA